MKITWYTTASICIDSNGKKILFDPFVPLKGSNIDVSISDYDGFDSILLTHGHFDHIVNILEIIQRNPSTKVYCTKTPYETLQKKGVPSSNLICISSTSYIEVNGFQIQVYPGKHANLEYNLMDRLLSLYTYKYAYNIPFILKENSICVENEETIYFDIHVEGKSIGLMGSLNIQDIQYPTCDVLILPYNGWLDNLSHAKEIVSKLQPKKIVLDHFDNSFPPFTTDMDLQPLMDEYGDKLIILSQKESINML